ncbi:MAG: hypothetical protein ACE5J3_01815, partial [Methanosarcinales archaeon]
VSFVSKDYVYLKEYLDKLSISDKEILNKSNSIKATIKKPNIYENGDWLIIKVDYTVTKEEYGKEIKIECYDVEVLKFRIGEEYLRKFLYYSLNNYNKILGYGIIFDKLKKIKIPKVSEEDLQYLMQEYLQAVDECNRLKMEIQATDNTIDKLVYELYGLREEEIKIVEESLKGIQTDVACKYGVLSIPTSTKNKYLYKIKRYIYETKNNLNIWKNY